MQSRQRRPREQLEPEEQGAEAAGGQARGAPTMEIEKEFHRLDQAASWALIYQDIRHEASDFPCKVAKHPRNKNRNRYRDVSPFDHSRIKLTKGDNDYINASLIKMEEAQRSYILTQGPLPNTCGHFWEMVWEQKSRGVVMLNRVMEKGSIKCAQYWPQKEEKEMLFEDTDLKLTLISEDIKSYYTVRQLELENLTMDKRKDPSSVDIKQVLLEMRKYRMGLIQTADQLRFSYLAVIEGAKFIMGDASVQEQWKELSNEDLEPPPEHTPPPPRPPKRTSEMHNGRMHEHTEFFPNHQGVEEEIRCTVSAVEEMVPDGTSVQLGTDSTSQDTELRRRTVGEHLCASPHKEEPVKSENIEEDEENMMTTWKPFLVNICMFTVLTAGAYLCYRVCFH
ncbi:tyrosine-protein phosphatase non-receptor type 1 isoform X2 [Trachemys scripta elegans]|uniref:tyrosine-protein phosphatase non-receptor type 1 isoform X2 n=1 Tax=Trachemys scripta elegans TaxID=31138 RepID=UPI001553CDF4|nr:tyrosine-protein phosphatase non-receptor type 1 isoform X2 [Trachemys scripta elegans]